MKTDPVTVPVRPPVVLVPTCHRQLGEHPFHIVGAKYLDAVRLAGAIPLVVPAARPDEIAVLLERADGVLLTGSPSNVDPRLYGEDVREVSLPLDPARDAWTLPLVRAVVARGLPLFAICRGFQEANVALGGSLHQSVPEQDDLGSHHGPDDAAAAEMYGPAHPIHVTAGGLLDRVLGRREITVNSVHYQGVNRLAPGARVEARAPDGLVEAFSIEGAPGFALCVQWHPEWQAATNPDSMRLLGAFGDACRAWRDRPKDHHRDPDT